MTTLPLTHTVPRSRLRLPRVRRRKPLPPMEVKPAPPWRTPIPPAPPPGAPLSELVDHVDAIASTFRVDRSGSFLVSKADYAAYRDAVNRAQDARAAAGRP